MHVVHTDIAYYVRIYHNMYDLNLHTYGQVLDVGQTVVVDVMIQLSVVHVPNSRITYRKVVQLLNKTPITCDWLVTCVCFTRKSIDYIERDRHLRMYTHSM